MEEDFDEDETTPDSFLTTAVKVAKSGFVLAPKAVYAARIEMCRNCPNAEKSKRLLTCQLCGCDMKLKARFSATTCPINTSW